MRSRSRLADIVERALWTLVQTASAAALVTGWNALDIGPDLSRAWVPPLAFVLSCVKGELATRFGNGTAATLPAALEPLRPSGAEGGPKAGPPAFGGSVST